MLRALVDHLYPRVELTQWWPQIEHVAQTIGHTRAAEKREHLDVTSVRKIMTEYLADLTTDQAQSDADTSADRTAQTDSAPVRGDRSPIDPLVHAWLTRHADLIATRLDALIDDAVTNPQPWMETVARRPRTAPHAGTGRRRCGRWWRTATATR